MEFLSILKESFKLLAKNGKLMALIALLSILLASTFFMLFYYSFLSLFENVIDTIMNSSLMPDPNSFGAHTPQMTIGLLRQDYAFILGGFIAWSLVISTIDFFLSISTIIVSSSSYKDQTSSLNGLISGIKSTWIRACITSLYVSALEFGCFFVLVTLVSPLLVYLSVLTVFVSICVVIVAFIFYLHFSVSWNLAIVVSVLEESCYGLEALARGAQLVRGKRFDGFLLNIGFGVVVSIIFQGCKTMLLNKEYVYSPALYGWVLIGASLVAKMFHIVAYSALYFRCKKHHGEEMELIKGEFEYTKLPVTQLAKDVP